MHRAVRFFVLAVMIIGTALTTGCASIVTGQNQSLSVETRDRGKMIQGAYCKLTNNKGTWYVTTPGSTVVHRSYGDLSVACKKDGEDPGITTVKSSTKGMAFGNILFGGVVGAGVDVATGAAYDYPSLITVEMGKTTVMAPPPKPDDNKPQDKDSAPKEGDQTTADHGALMSEKGDAATNN